MSEQPAETRDLSVPEPGPSSLPAIERFGLADDEKVLAALAKRVTQGFTYKANGKPGLSAAGTFWAVREFARQGEVIRVVPSETKIERCPFDPDNYVNVLVFGQRFFVDPASGREVALDSAIGHKRQSLLMKRYTDDKDPSKFELVPDAEAITKAITKAERNLKQKLLPKDLITNLINRALAQQNYQPPPARPAGQKAQGARPAGQGEGTAAAAAAAKTTAPPAGEPAPGAQKATQAAPPTGQQTAKPAKAGEPRDVKIQKLDAVLKSAFKTQDGAAARKKFTEITAVAKPEDLSDADIQKFGKIFQAVGKGQLKIEGGKVLQASDGAVVFQKPAPPAATEEAPPPTEEGEMF